MPGVRVLSFTAPPGYLAHLSRGERDLVDLTVVSTGDQRFLSRTDA